jgi:hypothetical protein
MHQTDFHGMSRIPKAFGPQHLPKLGDGLRRTPRVTASFSLSGRARPHERTLTVIRPLAAALALAVTGCTSAQLATAQSVGTAAAAPATALVSVAAAHNTTVADLIAKGALFCRKADGTVAAIATTDAMAAPVASVVPYGAAVVTVIGASASVVQGVCAAIQAVPVPAPTNVAPDTVPVIATAAAKVLKPAT